MISLSAVQLYNKDYFDVEDESTFAFLNLDVIAHGLSITNRFAGQTREPYSVAQHSVMVSYMCNPEDAQHALLHDASEGLGLCDLPTPIKQLLSEYKVLERRVMDGVYRKYNLDTTLPKSVHEADMRMCVTESRDLIDEESWKDWNIQAEPYDHLEIIPWNWQTAKSIFLYRCKEVGLYD